MAKWQSSTYQIPKNWWGTYQNVQSNEIVTVRDMDIVPISCLLHFLKWKNYKYNKSYIQPPVNTAHWIDKYKDTRISLDPYVLPLFQNIGEGIHPHVDVSVASRPATACCTSSLVSRRLGWRMLYESRVVAGEIWIRSFGRWDLN